MSPSSKRSFSSLCLSLFVVLPIGVVMGVEQIADFCDLNDHYRIGPEGSPTTIESNLDLVMKNLVLLAPRSGYASDFRGNSAEGMRGLALCKFGISTSDCAACVSEATVMVVKRCLLSATALIWYENCMVKYSTHRFLGQIDRDHNAYAFGNYFEGNLDAFNAKIKQLLHTVAGQCDGPTRFARGELDIGDGKKMYGSAQCTRDLSGPMCVKCLKDAVENNFDDCCVAKTGGRYMGGSCGFRFELYPF